MTSVPLRSASLARDKAVSQLELILRKVWNSIHDLPFPKSAYNDCCERGPARRLSAILGRTHMSDFDKSEALTEQLEISDELKQKLRTAFVTDEEAFAAGQQRVEEMIAAKAPLEDVLSTLVRMIEGQSPGMLCSVLLLSADGNHIQ